MKTIRFIICFAVVAALLAACSSRPDKVLDKESFASLLADMHRAEVVAETNSRQFNDSMRRVLRQSVYARHGVTSEEVDSSLSWYGYNTERYMDVYDRVIEILQKELDEAREQAGASTAVAGNSGMHIEFEGDSVDVWTGERFRRFSSTMPSDIITFNISSDENWLPGDAYTFRGKALGFIGPVEVTLTVAYRDGSYEYVTKQLNGDGWHDVVLPLDSVKNARSVYGVVSYIPRRGETSYLDSISLYRSRKAPYLDELVGAKRRFHTPRRRV